MDSSLPGLRPWHFPVSTEGSCHFLLQIGVKVLEKKERNETRKKVLWHDTEITNNEIMEMKIRRKTRDKF